jgi:hypothetical protein
MPLLLSKANTLINTVLDYTGLGRGALGRLEHQAIELLREHSFQAIIATGEPFSLFAVASRLSKRFNLPWIADYRDCWSNNKAIAYTGFQRTIWGFFEKKWVSSSQLITTAAPSYAAAIKLLFPNKPVEVALNGFFEEVHYSALQDEQNIQWPLKYEDGGGPILKVVHLGTLYEHQPVEAFLEMLEPPENTRVHIDFYGPQESAVSRLNAVSTHRNVSILTHHRLAHADAIRSIQQYHALMLLSDPKKPMLYGKAFDYIASGKPIVWFMPDYADLEYVLDKVTSVRRIYNKSDLDSTLTELLGGFRGVDIKTALTTHNDLSRRHQAGLLANLIKEAVQKKEI